MVTTLRASLERKIQTQHGDEVVGGFGELRRDEKNREKRKNLRITADLPSHEADVRFRVSA